MTLTVMIPPLNLTERLCAAAVTQANRRLCALLANPLSAAQRAKLDEWMALKPGTRNTWLSWLRQSPVKPNSRHMMEHIERLREFQRLALPEGCLERRVHQNRLIFPLIPVAPYFKIILRPDSLSVLSELNAFFGWKIIVFFSWSVKGII